MKPDERGEAGRERPFRLRTAIFGLSVAAALGGGAFLLLDPGRRIHPLLATAFLVAGALLAASGAPRPRRTALRRTVLLCALATAVAAVLQFADQSVLPEDIFHELAWQRHPSDVVSTLALGGFFLALILHHGPRQLRAWSTLPLVPTFWVTYFSLAATFYGVKRVSPYFNTALMPTPVALLFVPLFAGILALGASRGFMAVIASRNVGGALARVALPAILLLPFTVGWIRINSLKSGIFDEASAYSQFAATNVVAFGLFVWICAGYLNRLDARRQHAITSLQDSNVELQRVNRELEARIADHARAEAARLAAERELFESRKMESVGTLASGIAHDFNNLLTVILLNAEDALEAAPAQSVQRENLLEIRRSGGRAADVVRQLMTFARREPGRREAVDPGEAVREAAAMLRRMLKPDIEVHVDIASGLPTIAADSTQIQQVLLNLGTNAAHAMAEKGGRLSIAVHAGTAAGARDLPTPHVRITVTDTGHGIDPETLPRIFDPFFTTKPPGAGTGLGLSVADGILRSHGGAIRASSEIGRGTTISLYFPVAFATMSQ